MYNLFISYDLMTPGQGYDQVHHAIKSLGLWHQFQFSLFYVSSALTPKQAYDAIWSVMDANDKLLVIDAIGGVVSTGDRPPIAEINSIWFHP